MKTKFEYFILALIVIGALAVRLYKIDNPVADWHSWRQADTASVTRNLLERKFNPLYPEYHDVSKIQTGTFNPNGERFVEFPLFNVIHAGVFKVFEGVISFDAAGRLVAVAASLASLFFVYLLGKGVIGPAGGLIAAFFYAFIPFNIYFTRVILPEPLAVAFGVGSIYAFFAYTKNEKTKFLFLSSALFALGVLTKPPVLFYGIPIAFLAVRRFGAKEIFKRKAFFLALDVALIPFFLWRIWVNQFPRGIAHFLWAFNGDGIRFRPAFVRWMLGERLGVLILGIWGLAPFFFGIIKVKNKVPLFLHSFLAGVFLYSVVLATANVRHDYYQTFWIPALALVLAQGTIALWKAEGLNKFFSRLMLFGSVSLMIALGFFEVKGFYRINDPNIIEAGQAVDKLAPKDALVVAPYNGDTAFLYQTGRWGWPAIDDSIDNIIGRGADFYVSTNLNSKDTLEFKDRFTVIQENDKFIIIELKEAK